MHHDLAGTRHANVFVIYILGFLFTLHAALPAYINSTFLSKFTSEAYVGILYTFSALLTIFIFGKIPNILKKFGNYRSMFTLLIVDFIAFLGMALTGNIIIISACFILSFISIAVIGFNIDVFLESFSKNSTTGKIRGTFLSTSNIAWIIAPLICSFILTDGDYWKIFVAAGLLLLPIALLIHNNLKNFKDTEYKIIPAKSIIREIVGDKNIRSIFFVNFLLQFFYSWMIIYTPLYLYTYIGWSWREIGIMFSIMLVPFVLTEAPLGKLADTRWGEKEVMSVGFIVIALSTSMIAFIQVKSMLLWTFLLFTTRIGASMVEIMSETYFFKKTAPNKANVIGFFRTMRPWAYLISPILATGLFSLGFSIKYIFIILAVVMFFGLHFSLNLKDTR
ncbi:MAG: MFS transporter [Candidatus Taylorbacteria bacterium]|nr:MFS transporter [Candidatus Taylorbacteria bacterium]